MNRSIVLLLAFFSTGCLEATDKYPSLAQRPIETRSDAEPAPAPAAAPAPDAALDAKVAAFDAAIGKNAGDFATAAARADTAAKAPGAQAVGSDSWVGAQAGLADLESLRGDMLGTLTDLEKLATDRGEAGVAPYPALDAARVRAQAQLDLELAKIAAIKALLGEK
ncbi:MAG: hypothetical protein V4459_02980 [Pseudomonadota bacterium]